jgi:hypothetical protein
LTSELPGRPESNTTLRIRTEVTTAFKFSAELRGQDESALYVQRVLKLTDKTEHHCPILGSPLSPIS